MSSEEERRILTRLAATVSGELPLESFFELLAPRVRFHWEGLTTSITPESWARWLRFLREEGTVRDLRVSLDRLEDNPDGTVTAVGRWHGLRAGHAVESAPCRPRYRIVGGRISEIWTVRAHYAFCLGPLVESWLGLLWIYLRLRRWEIAR
jgi:hypothetical protein